jgi:hypothetical protein
MPPEQVHPSDSEHPLLTGEKASETRQGSIPLNTYEFFLAQALVQEAAESFDYAKYVREQR